MQASASFDPTAFALEELLASGFQIEYPDDFDEDEALDDEIARIWVEDNN